MTLVSKIPGLFLILFFLFSLQPAYAEGRSFEIGDVNIHARIDSDGNMHVNEEDTYHFNGIYHGIIVELNPAGSDGIENFQAFEVTGRQDFPLEFEESKVGGRLQYTIRNQSENETKLYKFTYSLKNVVQVYADTAELYWKFFDHTNPSALGQVQIDVELPEGAVDEEIEVFGHGPLNGAIKKTSAGTVQYQVNPLPQGELLEVRILFPGSYVPGSTKTSPDIMRDRIIEEEKNWTPQADTVDDDSLWVALLLLIANLTVGILLFNKFSKTFKSSWKGKLYRELPSDVAPAVVGYLMNYRTVPRDLMATLFDLVRRKLVTMQAVKDPDRKDQSDYNFQWTNKLSKNSLLPHEKKLIDWLFHEVGSAGKVSLSEIRRQAENKESAAAFSEQWLKWRDLVLQAVNRLNYIEGSKKRIRRWTVIAVVVQFFGIWLLLPSDWDWIMVCSLPLLFFVPKRRRRTKIGQTEYTKWQAFKRFLRHDSRSASREPLADDLWEHYYVYSIPLGEAKRVDALSRIHVGGTSFGLAVYDRDDYNFYEYHNYWISSFEQTISDCNRAINPSGGSGDDGGTFSSGGGDGGGGGGRGAF
jgi:uncharacterized membrane protein